MNINTTVEYTEQDMRRYYLASYLYKRWWALLMVAIMEIIIVTSSVIKREIGLLTIVYSVLVVFYLVFTPLRVIFYARKQYSTGKIWQKPMTFVITSDGITNRNGNGTSEFTYDDFHKYIVYRKQFALHISENQVYFLPRRAMTDSQCRELEDHMIGTGRAKVSRVF